MRADIRTLGLVAALGAAICSGPVTAQTAEDSYQALDAQASDAISLGFDGELEQARAQLLAVAAEADRHGAGLAEDNPYKGRYAELAGSAYYYTAQNHNPEWDDAAGQAKEVEWLTAALERLEQALALQGEEFEASYEYRGVAGQLWQHGQEMQDERWPQWSAARLAANRMRLAEFPDDAFEKNMVAEAMYDHGWLTQDTELLTAADAFVETIGEGDVNYGVRRKRDKVAAGEAPY